YCLVGRDSGRMRTDRQCHFTGRRHDMLREEEKPLQGLRTSSGWGRPQAAGLVTKIGEDRIGLSPNTQVPNTPYPPVAGASSVVPPGNYSLEPTRALGMPMGNSSTCGVSVPLNASA